VHTGLVATRIAHRRAQLVGHDQRAGTAEELDHPAVAGEEVRQLLARTRLRVRVARRAQHPDEELHGLRLASPHVVDHGALARVVDEGLLAGQVDLAHRDPALAAPAAVVLAELRVAVPPGLLLEVLQVQQLQRDASALELGVHGGEVGQPPSPGTGRARVQPRLELRVAQRRESRRLHARAPSALERGADDPHAEPQAGRYLPVAAALLPLLPQDLPELAHRQSLSRHRPSPARGPGCEPDCQPRSVSPRSAGEGGTPRSR
jgi:hypothetical protein